MDLGAPLRRRRLYPFTAPLSAAIATRTNFVEIGTSIAILPLQHPVRLAEDSLTVDALSGGRFRLGVGVGYCEVEFDALGVALSSRWSRMERGLQILRAAFDGRPLSVPGHPELDGVTVTPGPLEGGGPELWVGTFGPKGLDHAARYGDGLLGPIPQLWPVYTDACARYGRTARVAAGFHWIFGEDPERELERVAPYVMHQVNEYGENGAYGPRWQPVSTAAELIRARPMSSSTPTRSPARSATWRARASSTTCITGPISPASPSSSRANGWRTSPRTWCRR